MDLTDEFVEAAIKESTESLGINFDLKKEQEVCMKHLLRGKDVMAILPTGFGKSLIFHLMPVALEKVLKERCTVLCISPLVALMQDQVVSAQRYGLDAVYLGDQKHGTLEDLGVPQLIYVSPEAALKGKWRDALLKQKRIKLIVVDEAHCIEQWGTDFRVDYDHVGELRSMFKDAPVLALTATATTTTRKTISKSLFMTKDTELVEVSSDRTNIKYVAKKINQGNVDQLSWVVDELLGKRENTPKMLIYCRTIKDCSMIYKYLSCALGENLYYGGKSIKSALVAMYHHATSGRNKRTIIDTFIQELSVIRVVVCTVAFGMGINTPDIVYVVNFGASRTLSGFFQESGRAGRNGQESFSIVYYSGHNISKTATDDKMRDFCLLEGNTCTCRRDFLVEQFTPNYGAAKDYEYQHQCCDLCAALCECGNCPNMIALGDGSSDSKTMIASSSKEACRTVTDRERLHIREELLAYRLLLNEEPSLTKADIRSCLSLSTIEEIIENLEYYSSTNDLQDMLFGEEVIHTVDAIIMLNLD